MNRRHLLGLGAAAALAPADIPFVQPGIKVWGMDGVHVFVEKAGTVEFPQQRWNAPGAMDILHVVVVMVGSDL